MENPVIEATQLDAEQESVNTWAYVELFGHQKIAGRVTTRKLGTEVMFQVDVPKGDAEFSHSELFNPKAVFSIKPTTEEWCRKWAHVAENHRAVLPYIPKQLGTGDIDDDGDIDLDSHEND
jgi:hypothetical protein